MTSGQRTAVASGSINVAPAPIPAHPGAVSQPSVVIPRAAAVTASTAAHSSDRNAVDTPASTPSSAATPTPVDVPTTTAAIKPSAVLRPSAVLQPSAVLMPGAPVAGPRPAVVLPASAMNTIPYHGNASAKAERAAASEPTSEPAASAASIAQPAPPAARPSADVQASGTATFEPAPARRPATPQTERATQPEPEDDPSDSSETLINGSRADVVDIPLDDLDDAPAASATPTSEASTTGDWTPPQFGVAHEIIPLSPEAFHRLLPRFAAVHTRDAVTDLLLDFLGEGFSRVIMFTHIKGEIRGRDARGEDLMVEAVRQIRIPATGPSLFSGVIERRQPYFGPMRTDTAIDAAFYSALGGVDGVVLCLPVILRDKVPLIVFASGSNNPVDPRSLDELTHEVAAALERVIVADKARVPR